MAKAAAVLNHRARACRGEMQTVRAANAVGVPFCLSTVSVCPLTEVAVAATTPFWFQSCMIRDRGLVRALLDEAQVLGCSARVMTVHAIAITDRVLRRMARPGSHMLRLIQAEMRVAMALCGRTRISDIDLSMLVSNIL